MWKVRPLDEVGAMLEKVNANLLKEGATQRTEKIGGVDIAVFTMPKKREDAPTVEAYYAVYKDTLVACDHASVCNHIISRLDMPCPPPPCPPPP